MLVDAEFILKIKMNDLTFPNNISGMEMKQKLLAEGEKRVKFLSNGFLNDPDGKVITAEVNYKIKD